jgi:hypothetical protein
MHSAYEIVRTAASAIIQSLTGGQDQFTKEVRPGEEQNRARLGV